MQCAAIKFIQGSSTRISHRPSAESGPLQNRLLAAITDVDRDRLLPLLEPIDMPIGMVIHESGSCWSHVVFPTTAIVSLMYVLADGTSSQIAVVGREGIVGSSLILGGSSSPDRAIVLCGGQGYRLRADLILRETVRSRTLLHLLLHHIQALTAQIEQTALCNRHHTLGQQLCRWLLLQLDRHESNDLAMTHELIAIMLGVRRESVTQAASQLQKASVVSCRRGHITVLDRTRLERSSCECYSDIKKEYDRLLPTVIAHDHRQLQMA